jgi:hypothetical protein
MGMTVVSTFFPLPQDRVLMIPHWRGAVPAGREVFVEPVAPSAGDLSAICLEYVKYLEPPWTATEIALAVKLPTGAGTPGEQGELRIVLMTAA